MNLELETKSADDSGGDENAEIVTKALENFHQEVKTEVANHIADLAKKADERMTRLEARLNRPGSYVAGASDADVEKKAVDVFYRTGSDLEIKTLSTTTGLTGTLALPQLSTTVLEKITVLSPVRQLASSVSMSGAMISIPRLTKNVAVGTVAETTPDPRPEDEPAFEQIDLKSFEMSVFVPISRISLEDANIDLSSYIGSHLVKRFAAQENTWFVNGNGTTQPEGVLTSTEVGVYNASASTLLLDDLTECFYSLATAYSSVGSWLMNRATMALLRKMKSGDGSPLWQPSMAAGQPATLLGQPVYEAPDMPNATAGATPIIFGDFSTAYLIADRLAFEPLRDERATSPIIRIGGRRRVGGRVVMGEALTKLKLKA